MLMSPFYRVSDAFSSSDPALNLAKRSVGRALLIFGSFLVLWLSTFAFSIANLFNFVPTVIAIILLLLPMTILASAFAFSMSSPYFIIAGLVDAIRGWQWAERTSNTDQARLYSLIGIILNATLVIMIYWVVSNAYVPLPTLIYNARLQPCARITRCGILSP